MLGEDDGEPVGVAFATPARTEDRANPQPIPGVAHVSMLAVRPDRWGQGLGRTILEAVQMIAGERGFARAQLWTHESNRRARRLYERLGWRSSKRIGVDDNGEPIRHYTRDL
ncbi:acetyltransferase (GNAT) family protein [Halopolyspora algeriensis]|uniref:Acetyltransferase (GNAT) family protein n=1 Tax=Halopolyspora algeriensis TaxID=1500506 RepID=A0A368VUT3_9ACTN|nr:acetyltransferase (GNAT) family protein [Halopolyspora algeriensis]